MSMAIFCVLQLGVYNIGHYDAFILYALALRDTLAAGNDPTDGASMTKFLWNRTFQGNCYLHFLVHELMITLCWCRGTFVLLLYIS